MQKKRGRKKTVTLNISKEAYAVFKRHKVHLQKAFIPKDGFEKYTKKTFLRVYQGYDFLENFMLVRAVIQKKYKISLHELEALLYLYPKGYFSKSDFDYFYRSYHIRSIKRYLVKGLFTWVMRPKKYKNAHLNNYKDIERLPEGIFGISAKGRNIIVDFYKYLSGEEKIEIKDRDLKLKFDIDIRRKEQIDFLNAVKPPETKKALYQEDTEP